MNNKERKKKVPEKIKKHAGISKTKKPMKLKQKFGLGAHIERPKIKAKPKIHKEYSSNWKAFLKNVKQEEPNVRLKHFSSNKNRVFKKRKKEAERSKSKKEISGLEIKNTTLGINDIWFDDVDPEDIERERGNKVINFSSKTETTATSIDEAGKNTELNCPSSTKTGRATKRIALDCEMVGVGIEGKESILARVSLVNVFGEVVYDQFVAPTEKVVDYRTAVSGVRPTDLKHALNFATVQKEVSDLLKGKVLVGHALHHDMMVLMLSHPRKMIRDTSTYKPFKKLVKSRYPSLKKLSQAVLNIEIQTGEHSSVEDARVTMKIYQLHKKDWEKSLKGFKQKRSSEGEEQKTISLSQKEGKKKRIQRWRKERKNRHDKKY